MIDKNHLDLRHRPCRQGISEVCRIPLLRAKRPDVDVSDLFKTSANDGRCRPVVRDNCELAPEDLHNRVGGAGYVV